MRRHEIASGIAALILAAAVMRIEKISKRAFEVRA
jgi:hypothetical protein